MINNLNGIRISRQKLNMTQEDLALQMNVDIFTIKSWENGAVNISLNKLILLSKILKVSSNMILFGESRNAFHLNNLNQQQQDIVKTIFSTMQPVDKYRNGD